MEKIIIYFDKQISDEYKNFIKNNLKYNFNFEIYEEQNKFEDFKKIAQNLQDQTIDRAIIVDDYGSLPFMVMSKFKYIIVAQIGDYHSARMTIKHNNSNVLTLGYKLLAKENFINILESYLNATFDGGRHMVRINMLNNILEGN